MGDRRPWSFEYALESSFIKYIYIFQHMYECLQKHLFDHLWIGTDMNRRSHRDPPTVRPYFQARCTTQHQTSNRIGGFLQTDGLCGRKSKQVFHGFPDFPVFPQQIHHFACLGWWIGMIREIFEWIRLIVSPGGTIHNYIEEKHHFQIGRWPKENFETTAGRQWKEIIYGILRTENSSSSLKRKAPGLQWESVTKGLQHFSFFEHILKLTFNDFNRMDMTSDKRYSISRQARQFDHDASWPQPSRFCTVSSIISYLTYLYISFQILQESIARIAWKGASMNT